MLGEKINIKITRLGSEIDDNTNKYVETIIYNELPSVFGYIERKHFNNNNVDIDPVQNYYFLITANSVLVNIGDIIEFSDFSGNKKCRIIKEPRKTTFINESFIKLIAEKIG